MSDVHLCRWCRKKFWSTVVMRLRYMRWWHVYIKRYKVTRGVPWDKDQPSCIERRGCVTFCSVNTIPFKNPEGAYLRRRLNTKRRLPKPALQYTCWQATPSFRIRGAEPRTSAEPSTRQCQRLSQNTMQICILKIIIPCKIGIVIDEI